MRDYLFRGKTSTGVWVYGSLVQAKNFCCIMEEDDGTDINYPYLDGDLGIIDGQITPVIPETVGQYTGVCDKTGEKIFEGDIVHAFMDFGPAGFLPQAVDITCVTPHGYPSYQWEYFDMDTIVIIGNIHDTPELLRGV